MVNGWKVTAIIFILLFILQTALVVFFINLGMTMVENESECSVNICGDDKYDSYFYDDYEKICYCYTDGEITHQEFMKN